MTPGRAPAAPRDHHAVVPRRSLLLVLAGVVATAPPRPSLALELVLASVPEAMKAALLERARARGYLPVIVGLAVTPTLGGSEPTPAEASAHERAVAAARARLLADLGVVVAGGGSLAGPGISNVKLFEAIPFLALTASPAALERLLGHPLVGSVREDATARHNKPGRA